MEESIEAACASRQIAGVVLMAADKTGTMPHLAAISKIISRSNHMLNTVGDFHYTKSFGSRSLRTPEEPLTAETPMWMASFAKLLTTIAVLQCLEQKKLSLDTNVTLFLHELQDIKILTGFDENGEPILEQKASPITIRHLLTHTSGLSYDFFHPLLQRWRNSRGEKIASGPTIVKRFHYPIVYEPGTSWEYSSATDWAGRIVERVNDDQTLTEYMQAHILTPLGITDLTFQIDKRPDMKQKLAELSIRDATDDGRMKHTENDMIKVDTTDDMGGGGAFTSPASYMKVMQSLLANDEKLLSPETVDQMFEPQLNDAGQRALMEKLQDPAMNAIYGALPAQMRKDWTFAGLMNCEDVKDRRRAGAVTWIGLPNMNWVS
ncbi:hypothetical protein ACLMJK_000144 [Lecanora helva]